MTEWKIAPGGLISRKELHELYGGRLQGRISPSKKTPNVMLFMDPGDKGLSMLDGWSDSMLQFVGEGSLGDQEMKQGNRALYEHAEQGKAVRLFSSRGPDVLYHGQVSVNSETPLFLSDGGDE